MSCLCVVSFIHLPKKKTFTLPTNLVMPIIIIIARTIKTIFNVDIYDGGQTFTSNESAANKK